MLEFDDKAPTNAERERKRWSPPYVIQSVDAGRTQAKSNNNTPEHTHSGVPYS